MLLDTQNPATLATCGVPKSDLACGSITSENTQAPLNLQVRKLRRVFAFDYAVACVIANLVWRR
jgi:hypothetical protein